MRLLENCHLKVWGPRWTKRSYYIWPVIRYTKGSCVSDPACVFGNHLSVFLRIGRLFLGGFELMWG